MDPAQEQSDWVHTVKSVIYAADDINRLHFQVNIFIVF